MCASEDEENIRIVVQGHRKRADVCCVCVCAYAACDDAVGNVHEGP